MLHGHAKQRRPSFRNSEGSRHMPRKKKHDETSTLVRGADGHLYVISKKEKPVRLTESESEKLEDILEEFEKQLGKLVDKSIPRLCFGDQHSVHLTIPEVFMK